LNIIVEELVNSPRILQMKILDQRTCIMSKMLPVSTNNTSLQTAGRARNMGDTISEVQAIKVSTMGPDGAPTE
jgi:hypothetical protein